MKQSVARGSLLVLALVLAILSLTACDSPTEPEPLRFQGCDVEGPLRFDTEIVAALEDTDCRLIFGGQQRQAVVDYYALDISTEREVTIDLEVPEFGFDPVLILWEHETTIIIDVDDDGGIGLNSRLALSLAPGLYIVGVTSLYAANRGEYHLSVR